MQTTHLKGVTTLYFRDAVLGNSILKSEEVLEEFKLVK